MTGCMLVLSDYSCSKAVPPVDESMFFFVLVLPVYSCVSRTYIQGCPPMDGSEESGDDPVTIPIDGR